MLAMNLVLETLASGNIAASILEFPQYRVESSNREDAIVQIRADAQALFDRIEILPLELDLPQSESPWLKYAGMLKTIQILLKLRLLFEQNGIVMMNQKLIQQCMHWKART